LAFEKRQRLRLTCAARLFVAKTGAATMGITVTRQLIYTLIRSPTPDLWDNWVLEIGIRTTDGGITDDKMSCEAHEFGSQAEALTWLREKADHLGISPVPEKIGPTSVPLPLGNSIRV
jgi:hypothetical protein